MKYNNVPLSSGPSAGLLIFQMFQSVGKRRGDATHLKYGSIPTFLRHAAAIKVEIAVFFLSVKFYI